MKRYLLIATISCIVLPNFCMKNGVESKTQADTKAAQATAHNRVIEGDYLYEVDENNDRLTISNISNPAKPVMEGSVNTRLSPSAVAVEGNYAFVVNSGDNTLQVFDVSDPKVPVLIGRSYTGLTPVDLAVRPGYVYVICAGGNTLQVFDVSAPSFPVQVGSVATGNDPQTIKIDASDEKKGVLAYVAFEDGTSQTFNVTNPTMPYQI
jgi:hypothetical protein